MEMTSKMLSADYDTAVIFKNKFKALEFEHLALNKRLTVVT